MPIDVARELSAKTIERLVENNFETERLDFKERLDLNSRRSIVELAKDVLAFANTQGGHIVLGVEDGTFEVVGLSPETADQLRDSNRLNGLLSRYTGSYISVHCAVHPLELARGQVCVGVIFVPPSGEKIPAQDDGLHPDPGDPTKQRAAFRKGDVFVRKASSSRKAETPKDLRPARSGSIDVQLPATGHALINPYDFSRSATGTMFKGRQREIRALLAHLECGTHVAVYGLQRIGKTSLVREVVQNRVPASSRLSGSLAYSEIELQSLGSDRLTYKDLLDAILVAFASAGGPQSAPLRETSRLMEEAVAEISGDLKKGQASALLRAYERVLEGLASRMSRRLIIFLDEFTELCRKIEANQALIELRRRASPEHPNEMLADVALMRFFSSLLKNDRLRDRVTFVFAVRPFVAEFDRKRDLQILKLTAPVHLYHLDEPSAKALIEEPLSGTITYETGAVEYLYRLTDGHPYLIQFMLNEILNELIADGRNRLRTADIKRLEDQMITEGPGYDAQFEVLDSDYSVEEAINGKKANVGRGVIALIAKHGNDRPQGWVPEKIVISATRDRGLSVELATEILAQLVRAKILQEHEFDEAMRYRIAIPMLRKRYVRQNMYLKYFKDLERVALR